MKNSVTTEAVVSFTCNILKHAVITCLQKKQYLALNILLSYTLLNYYKMV